MILYGKVRPEWILMAAESNVLWGCPGGDILLLFLDSSPIGDVLVLVVYLGSELHGNTVGLIALPATSFEIGLRVLIPEEAG